MPDIAKRNDLVLQYRWLVPYVVKRLWPRVRSCHARLDRDDLVQAGFLGLILAAELYDPGHTSQARFITYAHSMIRGYILTEMNRNHLIQVPEKVRQDLLRVERGLPTKVSPDRLVAARQALACRPLPHINDYPDDRRDRDNHRLHEALDQLCPEDRNFLEQRFGLDDNGGATFKELGQRQGVSKQALQERQQTILKRLRRLLRA
jgi:RNA polymerase sigma factor (sigma-70 family)